MRIASTGNESFGVPSWPMKEPFLPSFNVETSDLRGEGSPVDLGLRNEPRGGSTKKIWTAMEVTDRTN